MALSMAEYALQTNAPRIEAVVMDLFQQGSVLARDIPFDNKEQIYVNMSRFTGALPDVNWLDINDEDIPEVKAVPKPFQEQAYAIRNTVKTDTILLRDKTQFQNPHAFSIAVYLQAVAAEFNDVFLNNTHKTGGNTKAIVGIRERIDNGTKYGVNGANKIDGGGLDISAAADADDWRQLVEMLNKLLWSVNSQNGEGVVIYANHEVLWRISSMAAKFAGSGGLSQAQDQFGRVVTSFRGARFEDIGLKKDQASSIITTTETAGGVDGASTFTSLYAVNYGAKGVRGWQYEPIKVMEVPDPTGTKRSTLIEWVGGIACPSTRTLARVYNIKFS